MKKKHRIHDQFICLLFNGMFFNSNFFLSVTVKHDFLNDFGSPKSKIIDK